VKKTIAFTLMVILAINAFSQADVTIPEKALKPNSEDSLNGWDKGTEINISISQLSLTNWAAGGENSLAINGILSSHANYRKDKFTWDNNLDLGYGVLKKGDQDFFKSNDKLEINTKAGYGISDKVSVTGLINFKSQVAKGYPSSDDLTLISDRFSPGYLVGALGIDWKPKPSLSVFVSPLASKMTFVMNDSMAGVGAFGVDEGKNFRGEFGGYARLAYNQDVTESINLQSKLDLFSNYLVNPSHIDVNWEVLLFVKANKWLTFNVHTHLIYDKNIEIGKDTNDDGELDDFAPRVQFKELIGVGLSFKL